MMWKSVAATLLVNNITGVLWYHPALFGGPWMKRTFPNKRPQDIQPSPWNYALTMVSSLMANALIYYILQQLRVASVGEAAQAGAVMSGIVALVTIPHYTFASTSPVLFFIDRAYDAVVMTANAALMIYVKNNF